MVLLMAFGAALDPMRLAISVLLLTRQRPVLTLFAFWLGGMVTGVVGALVVLLLLRDAAAPLSRRVAAMADSQFVAPLQVVGGILALAIAAKIAIGLRMQQPVPVSGPLEDAALLSPEPGTQNALARVSGRLRAAMEGGNPWVAFVVGLGSATPPVETLILFTTILASGAAIEVQFGAALLFTVLAFTVVEIPLLTYLVWPAMTKAVMARLQVWLRSRRSHLIVGILSLTGLALVATGTGVI